jgi:hypothetical protein
MMFLIESEDDKDQRISVRRRVSCLVLARPQVSLTEEISGEQI